MDFDEYQHAVDRLTTGDLSETRSAFRPEVVGTEPVKKIDDSRSTPLRHGTFLGQQLIQLAEAASSHGVRLSDLAAQSLIDLDKFSAEDCGSPCAREPGLPLDSSFPIDERFPRSMRFVFTEHEAERGSRFVRVHIVEAAPNPFLGGPTQRNGKPSGFRLGSTVGAPLSDNNLNRDGYRYHDAIHIAFATVLWWSPVLRSLLNLKRRSDAEVDDAEDGARAIFTEEGIAAILAQRAKLRANFANERAVDFMTVQIVREISSDLEVSRCPDWRWRLAIATAFQCMAQLKASRGGVLVAELDTMSLRFEKLSEDSQWP